MVGPVLYLELLLGSRRGRQYIFRWLYAGWLILQLGFYYLMYRFALSASRWTNGGRFDTNLTGQFASDFVELFVAQQTILLLLATPAFVAGSITDEKTRGTLQYLLTASVTAGEVVLGKLLGGMAHVALLALVGLPVLGFIGVYGGIEPVTLMAILAISVAPLFALSAASVLASVWSRHTRDAVLALYVISGVGLLLLWGTHHLAAYLAALAPPGSAPGMSARVLGGIDAVLQLFNPLYVLDPVWGQGNVAEMLRRLLASVLAWGSVGAVCLCLATWRLRAAYLRQLEGEGRPRKVRWWQVTPAPIGDDPIRWKEQHIDGIAPLAVLRQLPRWVGVTLIAGLTIWVSGSILWSHRPSGLTLAQVLERLTSRDVAGLQALVARSTPSGQSFLLMGLVVVLVASLIVGIRCSGAISGAREGQTWEALLLTPLETSQLVRGKLRGIMAASVPYLLAYAVPAVVLAPFGGFMALFWLVLCLAVTALAMYFVGAAGIWCSARFKSSWKSLLGTLGLGYVGGFLVCAAVASPVIAILTIIILVVLHLIDTFYGTQVVKAVGGFETVYTALLIASCLGLAASFYVAARFVLLKSAENWVAMRERIRHWKEEPSRWGRRRPEPSWPQNYR